MIRYIAAASLLALAACTGGAQNTGIKIAGLGAGAASVLLSAEDIATMKGVCQTASGALDIAASPGMPAQVKGTAVYPKAFCDQLLAGTVPATADASSPQWLNTTLAVLSGAARVAGVVLPLLL